MNSLGDDLKNYSDEELWRVVQEHLTSADDERLHELVALGKQGRLTEQERVEMERLIGSIDYSMLLRSQALVLLKQRGYEIEKQLKLTTESDSEDRAK